MNNDTQKNESFNDILIYSIFLTNTSNAGLIISHNSSICILYNLSFTTFFLLCAQSFQTHL